MKLSNTIQLQALSIIAFMISATTVIAIDESTIKAVFIEKIIRYIEWPVELDITNNSAFTLCTFRTAPLNSALEKLASNTLVKGKHLKIRYVDLSEDMTRCHSLYIPSSQTKNLSAILNSVATYPILTLSDSDGFASMGVMINFYFYEGRLQFEININAGKSSGLMLSARILKLARIIKTTEQ